MECFGVPFFHLFWRVEERRLDMSQIRRLSYEDRKTIEEMLDGAYRLTEIAEAISHNPTTVSREVLRNRIALKPLTPGTLRIIICAHFASCKRRWLCNNKECNRACRSCKLQRCEDICEDFSRVACKTTTGFPHVCNGCEKKRRCSEERFVYQARTAEVTSEKRLHESRSGVDMSEAELVWLSNIITPLIRRGQSVNTILANHPEIAIAPSTLYKYIALGKTEARYIDLVRAVRVKRRKKRQRSRLSQHVLDGRSYKDFLDMGEEDCDFAIEMDTVIGRRGGRALLTFCSREDRVFYAYLMSANSAEAVKGAFDEMERRAKGKIDVLPLILLTDNGSEFVRTKEIEESFLYPGTLRASVFYCDPYASWQKPHVENAHTLLRRVLPKKTSFDDLSQQDIELICSHINSYARKELDWKSPFERLEDKGLLSLMGALGMRLIPPDDINLTPGLLS